MARIGFVGLGAMGGRVAARLLGAGHEVYGYNRTPDEATWLVEHGLIWRTSPRSAAEAADVVFSMVTDDAALEAVTSGPEGILAGLAPGNVYIDMSTVSPHASRELAERVRARGADMLDAPVSGSVPAAEEGSLAVIVGGDEDAFERVGPILRQLGRSVTRVGGHGEALLLKLAINVSVAVQMLALSEGVLLAERSGIDRRLAVDVLTESAIGSPMLKSRAPLILDLPDEAWFDVRLMQKDLGLALQGARDAAVPLPMTAVAHELLTAARAMGYGEQDLAAVFEVLAQLAGSNGSSTEVAMR